MKKLATLCVAAMVAALLVLGTAPGASAYPDLGCDVTVDRQTVSPGDRFTATGSLTGADTTKPVRWTFRWNGVTTVRTGATAKATFTAPKSKKGRVIRLTGEAQASVDGVDRTCTRHLDITVTGVVVSAPGDVAGSGSSGLPSTGGPAFWALVAGLALLLAGAGAVVGSRRRGR
jgi:LPXTG-motif cell wall-anchored protein